MKLLIIEPYLATRGGAERVILQIAKHYDSKIYTLSYDKKATFKEFEEMDIKILNKGPVPNLKLYQGFGLAYKFYNMKIYEDYDVINAHLSPSELIRHKNQRVLWYCHNAPLRFIFDKYQTSYKAKIMRATLYHTYGKLDISVVKEIEQVVTNSTYIKEILKKYFNKEARVIPPGVDYNKFENEGYDKYFLCVSRITKTKNQKFAIDAYARFIKKTTKKDYRLIIAGPNPRTSEDMEYFRSLREASKNLNIEFRMDINQKQLLALYANASAVLFTGQNESFGLVPLEAMSCYKPLIALGSGGVRETIINKKTGFIVNSEEEMAKYMKYLAENPHEIETMGKASRRLVETKYSWSNFFKNFDKSVKEANKPQ